MTILQVCKKSTGLLLCVFIFGCGQGTPESMLSKAKQYLADGEISSAVIEFKNVLQVDPRNAEAQLLLGETYISMGELSLALRELEGALDSGIDKERVQLPLLQTKTRQGRYREVVGELGSEADLRPELKLVLGEAYLAGADASNARQLFEQVLSLQPKSATAVRGLALVAAMEGHNDQAIEYMADAVHWNPNDPELWIQKGNLELANVKPNQALDSFLHAVNKPGFSVLANLGVARSNMALGNSDEAFKAIDLVLAASKKLPVPFYIKAQILFQRGEYGWAEKSLDQALKIAPGYPAALYLKAAALFQQERYALAASALRTLLKNQPKNMQVRMLMASSQVKTGDLQSALKTLEPYADEIQSSRGLALLGTLYIQNGQNQKASAKLTEALALDPANAEIRTQLALAHLAGGDRDAAISELERAVERGGENTRDDALLVLIKMRSGKPEEALLEAQNFQSRYPESVIAYNLLGAAHLALSGSEAAKQAFEKAAELDATYAPATFNLAKMASTSGDLDGARSLYNSFIKSNPNNIEGYIELARLEFNENNLDAAISNLKHAASLDISENSTQKISNIPFQLGLAHLKKADANAARKYFNQALDISSWKHMQALLGLIQLEINAGDHELAKSLLLRLKELDSNSGIYYMLAGKLEFDGGDLRAAKRYYKKAVELKHRAATIQYADMLASLGEVSEAIRVLTTWVATNNRDQQAQAILGGLYIKEENGTAAIEIYEPMALRSPNNAAVLNNLAWAYHLVGDDRAEKTALKAYEISPENPHMADTFAWILVKNGKATDSLDIFDKALKLKHDNASIYYHAAVAYSQNARSKDARSSLDQALSLGSFPERALAEKLSSELNR